MINRTNYQYANEYLTYLRSQNKRTAQSLKRYEFYLRPFLLWADERPISQTPSIRPTFPEHIASLPSPRGSGNLAAETQKKDMMLARGFLTWLMRKYPREFRNIDPDYVDTLNPIARPSQSDEHEYVSLDEVIQLATYPIDRSNLALWAAQAAVAWLFLSGQRASAFVTTPIKAVHLNTLCVEQKPELGVHTKNGKIATTDLHIIPELLAVVREWDAYVRQNLPEDAVWYAPVANRWGELRLSSEPVTINRRHTLIKRLNQLSKLTGLPYRHPHLYRHGYAVYGLLRCRTMAQYQSVSRNMMHSSIEITDRLYAGLDRKLRAEIMSKLGSDFSGASGDELVTHLNQINPVDAPRAIQILAGRIQGMVTNASYLRD